MGAAATFLAFVPSNGQNETKIQRTMKAKQSMMTSLLVLAMAQTILSCMSCGNSAIAVVDEGPQTSEIRHHRDFEKIEIAGSPKVYFTQADSFSVRVEGPENLIDKIITSTDDHTLSIRNKGKVGFVNITFNDMDKVVVYVSSPDLVSVGLNGSGDFYCHKRIDTDNMNIILHGSGNMEFSDIICDHCVTELVGSGDIRVDRLETKTSDVSLIGSGDLSVNEWQVDETDVSLKGSGDVRINFVGGCRKASGRLTGSGDMKLKGSVKQFMMKKEGSGDIDTDELRVNSDK
jgi:hypothetical protein